MKETSKVNALICDHAGMFVSWAEVLALTFHSVSYHTDSTSDPSPIPNKAMIGSGLEGVERVQELYPALKAADLIIFPDCYSGELLTFCRDELNKPCWGAGPCSELELDRWYSKELLRKAGLPYNPTERVIGVNALRAYMQKHPDKVIKVSKWRGICETWKYKTYELSKPKIDQIAVRLGPFADQMPFYVEDVIESESEPGWDGFSIDGQFPKNTIIGYEVKDKSYIGAVIPYDRLYPGLMAINTALLPTFKRDRYRGWFSSEARISEKGRCFPIDLTCRSASPAGESYQKLIGNWPDIIWHGAHGILVEPKFTARYVAQVLLTSEWAESGHQPLYYPEKIERSIKLYNKCKVGSQPYVVYITSQDVLTAREIGSVVGTGNTVEAAIEACKKNAEQVEGYLLSCNTSDLDEAADVIAKGEKAGIHFGQKLRAAAA